MRPTPICIARCTHQLPDASACNHAGVVEILSREGFDFCGPRRRPRRTPCQAPTFKCHLLAFRHAPRTVLRFPSPPAFTILYVYMYSHRVDAVLITPLPLPASSSPPSRPVMGQAQLPPSLPPCPPPLPPAHPRRRQNMIVLGVDDAPFWDALDLVWEVVLGGMDIVAD
ncbi:hypothetical protein K438DRAFT_1975259 [Mycena galopus ATCC 62051]|nr:hypothetical protein K438DRAFT_1975259 [Mycena galopus ATCC 62051]